ncbi:hypothetical protein HN873_004402 [Arachis hypogaea]
MCNAVQAELQGVLHGLRMAADLGMRRVVVEVDAMEVYEMLKDHTKITTCHSKVLREILSLIRRPWEISFNHVGRETNKCAHWLAQTSIKYKENFCFLDSSPFELLPLLSDDANGVNLPQNH